MIRRAFAMLSVALGLAAGSAAAARIMDWDDLLGRPRPKADASIAYGRDRLQHVDLWRPRGRGPFPVVVMIHGGCWRTDVATADIMDWAADDLRRRGIAVWNVEYRGVDRPGGGYPGTFLDIAAGSDLLGRIGARYGLRTDRVVVLGHSAGGHLAL
ncbi:alpha/beta hydrolase [Sphingomonas sp. BIUV-7]|uniref:Alpha/beta hydrolase n=1 Tax=Sphingomonas natans TaxID=3063330 RepID=A0ABT8Y4I6_9SPHN|nr:alpha/beta hydrolase [Sphingomonas sp. BIUV-7]MDO6413223.1 alpha/beta hydrolase [Sphingomonas sp. BIUV-7]